MPKLVRAISENGGIIMYALDSTEIVRDMERIHKTSAVASASLGRLLTAALLMGTTLKRDRDSMTVRIKGDGPLGMVIAVADGKGNVKGYVQNANVYIPARVDGKLDVGGAVGHNGTLSVVKDIGLKEPYVGQTELVTGEIAEDITAYYAASEQTPTVCALGVLVNTDLTIIAAGGYLVQLLPGATDMEIDVLERNVAKATQVTELIRKGCTPKDIIDIVLDGFNPNVLDETEVQYACDCSKERVERALLSLGKEELTQMQADDNNANVKCDFCNKSYNIELSKLLRELYENE
ncbi:MAG: Hsp33 family molecular chaperone HslO [Oscillospiraceae bacterium]